MLNKRNLEISNFDILSSEGVLGYYMSCEVTQLFIFDATLKKVTNFYILLSFEEKAFGGKNEYYLTEKGGISVNGNLKLGIKRYWITIKEAKQQYLSLRDKNNWDEKLILGNIKELPNQFIPSTENTPLNHVLKNNFQNGSYLIEFFDESKEIYDSFLDIKNIKQFNELSLKIKQYVPLDLSVVRDRVGNIVFQFPINIVRVSSRALKEWNGSELEFIWHPKKTAFDDCYILLESEFDKNTMGNAIVEYNKQSHQKIISGCVDNMHRIRFFHKETNLILYSMHGAYLKGFATNIGIINPEPRIFLIDNEIQKIDISSPTKMRQGCDKNYSTFIQNRLYDDEKNKLIGILSFKQYFQNQEDEAINDIRRLIAINDENGVYLWDPYLKANDVLKTLYFSKTANAKLRAIGSVNKETKDLYKEKDKSVSEIIESEKQILGNPEHNNYGLSIEFRLQHHEFGWKFHDRFLIFPGSNDKKSKAYSLGTSINSLGKKHHILQEVSYPQRIVDAYEELWEKLDYEKCIVWKSQNN